MDMKSMMKVMTKRKKVRPFYNRRWLWSKDWLCFEDPRVEEVERTIEFVQRVRPLHIEEPFRQKERWETDEETNGYG